MTAGLNDTITLRGSRDWAGVIRGAGLFLIGALFLAASTIWLAPELAADWSVRDSAVPRADARLVRGSCKTRLIVQTCDLHLRVGAGPAAEARTLHYVFGSTGAERSGVTVLASPSRPGHLTTDMGLAELTNRTMTLGFVILACCAALLAGLRGVRRSLAAA